MSMMVLNVINCGDKIILIESVTLGRFSNFQIYVNIINHVVKTALFVKRRIFVRN